MKANNAQEAIMEEPPLDTNGRVIPVRGSRSTEPKTLSAVCIRYMVAVPEAAMA